MQVSSKNISHYLFLSAQQNKTYNLLDKDLREKVFHVFLQSKTSKDIDHARFLLDVVAENSDLHAATTRFFFHALDTDSFISALTSLKALQSNNSLHDFFQFISETNPKLNNVFTKFQNAQQHKNVANENPLDLSPKEKIQSRLAELKTFKTEEKNLLTKIFLRCSGLPTDRDVQDLIAAFTALLENYGKEAFISFCKIAAKTQDTISFSSILTVLDGINSDCYEPQFMKILLDFSLSASKGSPLNSWRALVFAVDKKNQTIHPAKKDQEQDFQDLLSRFQETKFPIAAEKLLKMEAQYKKIQRICAEKSHLEMNELIASALELQKKDSLDEDHILELIALGRLAIYVNFQIYLHNTQILTILAKLLFPKGCVAQVKTGEGKSKIITLMAFVCVMLKNHVHIISSSPSLSIRDQANDRAFFEKFAITTNHICIHQPSAERFQSMITYGTATDFEFALMREIQDRKNLFPQAIIPFNKSSDLLPQKRFDVVIVDELDNLTIDTSQNEARLSAAKEISYEWIYVPIFSFVRDHCSADIPISEHIVIEARKFLSTLMNNRFYEPVQALPDEVLKDWLCSAHQVLFNLKKENDYIIQDEKALIVDVENTEKIIKDSRWSKGIHEFVEIKHSLPVMKETLVPISLSHSIYYLMYKKIFGLTGTIGTQEERAEILEAYGLESFDVPTHVPSQRIDHDPICCATNDELLEKIIKKVIECKEKGRPILVLCKTIEKSQTIHERLLSLQISAELLNEVQENQEEYIIEQAGHPGTVTIATNTAGRGTDVKLTTESRMNGGLHAFLAFFSFNNEVNFPSSSRVEEQARGRSGRQGDPGSSEMVVVSPHGITIKELQKEREQRISVMKNIRKHHSRLALLRFSIACEFYQKLSDFHENVTNHLPELAKNLAQTKLLNLKQPNFAALSEKDATIGMKIFTLLTGSKENLSSSVLWSEILTSVLERIFCLVTNDWAINFYQKTENNLNQLKMHEAQLGGLKDVLGSHFVAELEAISQGISQSIEKEIKDSFEVAQKRWDDYLDPSGKGLLLYLREVRNGRRPYLMREFA